MSKPHIVLASQSPRRIMLLEQAGYRCRVIPSQAEEADAHAHDIHAVVVDNARAKGEEVIERLKQQGTGFAEPTVLIAADTLVVMGDKVYPKPRDLNEAETFLIELGGREHQVLTGVFLYWFNHKRAHSFYETTRVVLKSMTHEEIMALFQRVTPLDKAAGYGFQAAPEIVTSLTGSETNVIGLPMERLVLELTHLLARPLV